MNILNSITLNDILIFVTLIAIIIYTLETIKLRKINFATLSDNRINTVIETHNNMIKKFELEYNVKNVFEKLYLDFRNNVESQLGETKDLEKERVIINKAFGDLLYNDYRFLVGYYSTIMTLITLIIISKKTLDKGEYNRYLYQFTSIVNTYEGVFLFYSGINVEDFGKDLDSNEFLKFLIFDDLLIRDYHIEYYKNLKSISKVKP